MRAVLANSAWLAASLPAWRRFVRALDRPEETQAGVLRRQLRLNRDTAYGRVHGFGAIRDYDDFARLVPLVTYDDVLPYVQRIAAGEPNVLTSEPVSRLMPTSGSTGARKLIPFTSALQREFNAAIGPWIVDLARQFPRFAGGPAYWSITPIAGQAPAEGTAVPIGFADDSEYLGCVRHRLIGAAMAVPSAVARLADIETFRRLVLLFLLRQRNLRLISVWHPSFLALLFDELGRCWDGVLCDMATGGCTGAEQFPDALRARVASLRPLPARAEELRRLGPADPTALWPSLGVVSCWGDANARFALTDLASRLPRVTIQPKGLLGTEAFVTIPFAGHYPAALQSHFFEFIGRGGRVRRLHELAIDHTYEVVVTTGGGLWRYRTGDDVEVTGFCGRTPSLRFIGRGARVSDLCGEKLSESFVAHVLSRALHDGNRANPSFAMLAPERAPGGGWRYTLFVEGLVPGAAADRVEQLLRENPHYAYCRDLGQLQRLDVCRIARDAYTRFVEAEIAAGGRSGEIKPTALSRRTDWRGTFE